VQGAARSGSKVHKPDLDEMGIALYHEVAPHRPGGKLRPRKPGLDEMGPGLESVPARSATSPRSTLGRGGMHGGRKGRKR
jgi:excinuclease ABC subunit B